jgi:peptide/nickel transport system substrate-binding protein
MTPTLKRAALALAVSLSATAPFMLPATAGAATFRIADQGDALSMDPHSLNESLQLSFTGNVYEPLVARDKKLGLAPGLATSWKQTDPTTWRFELRKGVKFHDGSAFTADDVIFSWKRAAGEGSDVKTYVGAIKDIRKVGDHTIDIVTNSPFPILPDVLSLWYIMSKSWCETNSATQPVDKRKGVEEVIFTPIGNDATRVAALISGEIDMMQPVPVQDVARLSQNAGLKIMQGPELRTIFLGMDQKRDELLFSNVRGKNPFKDKRVRQAFYQAIDIEAIKTRIMRGAAAPTALMVGPGIKGFVPELNKRLPYDPEAAKKLLADAGYPAGFEIKMNCPNDRYVNDGEICQAVAGMLARVGVKVNLEAESKATYFPKILSRNTSFYLLGWTPGTYDSHNPLFALMATPGAGGQGQFNLGSYSNPKLDELTAKVASETDQAKRNAMITEAFRIHADDIGHLPLHQQALAWGMKKNVSLVQLADNFNPFKYVVIDTAAGKAAAAKK